ncbi:DUF255 domain-containing protein [Desulfobacula sp.]|uniref:thioredoxin domain-containing protein n=1 Tax=Desulfobacula sp. TaxID=2593537 RepID=UPI00261ABB9A|nr:DUF255 domain-containing protein [Desulfobacula sp.]
MKKIMIVLILSLLSIGYSTCHWCHVMEEESFEDEDIARFLNLNYIAIKVDREERPDIYAIYMTAVQVLTGGGGWPLNVWLTPDKHPFYGGTYFPARDGNRGMNMGFLTLLERLAEVYKTDRGKVENSGHSFVNAIRRQWMSRKGEKLPDAHVLHAAAKSYTQGFDPVNGGLKGAPKFPSSLPVRFLLRYWRRTGDPEILEMARTSLMKMAAGITLFLWPGSSTFMKPPMISHGLKKPWRWTTSWKKNLKTVKTAVFS